MAWFFLLFFFTIYLAWKLTFRPCYSKVCLVGKTVLITGGSRGIGLATSMALAARGCRVIVACRSNCEKVKQKIVEETGNPNVTVKYLDLQSLESVRKFAKEINETESKLDVLINNAGIGVAESHNFTKDGLHPLMQANYFGHFLLTHLLTDLLKKSAPSRIVFLTSQSAILSDLSVENFNCPEDSYKASKYLGILPESYTKCLKLYANSKAAIIMMSNEFGRRLKKHNVTSNAVHPGLVATSIFESLDNINTRGATLNNLITNFCMFVLNLFAKNEDEGAQPTLRVAISKEYENVTGKYVWDFSWQPTPSVVKNEELARAIWEKSEQLVKLQPDERISK